MSRTDQGKKKQKRDEENRRIFPYNKWGKTMVEGGGECGSSQR